MPGIRESQDRPGTGHRAGRPAAQTHPTAADSLRHIKTVHKPSTTTTPSHKQPNSNASVRTLRAQTGLLKAQNMIDFIATICM